MRNGSSVPSSGGLENDIRSFMLPNEVLINCYFCRSVSPSLSIGVKRSVSQAEVTNVRAETTDAKSGGES